jgi:hypothetical protein
MRAAFTITDQGTRDGAATGCSHPRSCSRV